MTRRWGRLIAQAPARPSRLAALGGALGIVPFALALSWWGSFGPGGTGPQGMDMPAQRTVLLVSGLLSGAAFVVPFSSSSTRRWPRLAWLTVWTGCCVTALQGPAQLLLAHGGDVEPVVAGIALLSTPGACVFGLHLSRQHVAQTGANPGRPARHGRGTRAERT